MLTINLHPEAGQARARANQKRYRERHPERALASVKAARAKKPEKYRAAAVAQASAWRKANPERSKARSRRHRLKAIYGITEATYNAMRAAQGNHCAICDCEMADAGRARACLDHDHSTKKVREIVCTRCNLALAVVDNDEFLAKLIVYRDKHRGLHGG